MSTVLECPEIELAEKDCHAFNLAIWKKLQADPVLAALDYRIETDKHGQIIMSPPPAPSHGSKQSEISYFLRSLKKSGKVISECPISTKGGVKAADVAWCSQGIWERVDGNACFLECPEICIEVLSPSNTRSEIAEKKNLYFAAGAKEVWICHRDGKMDFFLSIDAEASQKSSICSEFPDKVN